MSEWIRLMKRADFNAIASRYGISPILARLIRNRDIESDEDIDMYLNGNLDNLRDASRMTDMLRACSLIREYISDGLKFRIIGDYDVDGICSTYILERGIRACGGDVDHAIPHRIHDGYGINIDLIDNAYADGIKVIVTCDNGIAAAEQIRHAYDLGLHVIVTDHHQVPFDEDEETGERLELLPPAEAVVDPCREGDEYGFGGICGAVVTWKLVGILMSVCGVSADTSEKLLDELIVEASLATVCDVMELRDENRIIVKEGLKRIAHTSNKGLRALIRATGLDDKKITAYHYGFILGPCLNAAGRLDSASRSLELLLCEDDGEAAVIANELRQYNEERKAMTDRGLKGAIEDIENSEIGRDRVLVVYLPDIHESVAGLIAGKLREKYEKPVIVFTDGEEGIKGSGRSIDAYDMYEELAANTDLYAKFGGHKMAAGLTLAGDFVDELRSRLNAACTLTDNDLTVKTYIDIVMPPEYATESLVNEMELMEPFGNGNKKPVFAMSDLAVIRVDPKRSERAPLGIHVRDTNGRQFRLKMFDPDNMFMDGVDAFYGTGTSGDLYEGAASEVVIDIIYTPGINEYNGRRSVEYTVNDYRFNR